MISPLALPTPKPRPTNLATPFALGPAALRPSQSLRVWTKFVEHWLRRRWGQPTNQHQPFCSLPFSNFGLQLMFFVSWTQHGFGWGGAVFLCFFFLVSNWLFSLSGSNTIFAYGHPVSPH